MSRVTNARGCVLTASDRLRPLILTCKVRTENRAQAGSRVSHDLISFCSRSSSSWLSHQGRACSLKATARPHQAGPLRVRGGPRPRTPRGPATPQCHGTHPTCTGHVSEDTVPVQASCVTYPPFINELFVWDMLILNQLLDEGQKEDRGVQLSSAGHRQRGHVCDGMLKHR